VLGSFAVSGGAVSGGKVILAPGATATVTLAYKVLAVATGATDSLKLKATSAITGTTFDFGAVQIQVVRAALTIAKDPYRDDKSTPIGAADEVLPNEYVQYRIEVKNTGLAAASNVVIIDPLASELTYDTVTPDASGWTITTVGGGMKATLTGTLAPNATRYIWVRAKVK